MPDSAEADRLADHTPVLRQHGYHSLRVARVVPETGDASSFVLEVPAELAETFRYRAGQFCTFRVRLDGEEHLRSYSMSSAPGNERDLTVTVKRVAGGLVSNWFLDMVSGGSVLELTKPAGVFCPQETDRPLLGFCGGSGVTPVMSIARHVLATSDRDVRLLYANRDPASVIFGAELRDLSARYPERFAVRHHLDADRGFLTTDDITTFAAGALDADIYICGPSPFMDLVEATLHEMGLAGERIFIERFLVEEQEKDAALRIEAATESDSGPGGADVPDEVTVILGGKSAVVRYQPGDTLLEAARRGGLRPPFSCESGNCATCMAFLKEGRVEMRVNNALSPDEVEEGWILTCQGLPRGRSVIVEYEPM